MAGFPSIQVERIPVAGPDQTLQLDTRAAVRGLSKYRRTVLFAITALLVMVLAATLAATKVNNVIAGLAEKQIINLAEENTTKDARHIQSMVIGGQVMPGMFGDSMTMDQPPMVSGSGGLASNEAMSMDQTPMVPGSGGLASSESMAMTVNEVAGGEAGTLSLDMLASPSGLPAHFGNLVEGLGVLESRLFSPAGEIRWSTGSYTGEQPPNALVNSAVDGDISSVFIRDRILVGLDGNERTVDIVDTFVPLRDSSTSPVVGVLAISREVGTDLGQLVNETKSTVVWTIVVTMAGLFFALVGFVVVSDRIIHQSNQRQIAVVESQLAERDRAQKDSIRAQQLIAASENLAAMGQISAGVAHDLRSPLATIGSHAFMIKKRRVSDGTIEANPNLGRHLENIELQISRSNSIISDLMTLARVGSPTLAETRLDHVLEETDEATFRGDKDNFEVSQQVDRDLFSVMADGDQLHRVFVNLANNARDAMPDGGKLTITAKNVGNHVEIKIFDTGEGISDENIERIFDPLFTTKTKGTGLGLAICQEVIQQHSGTISAHRNGDQSDGSTFIVRLPAADGQRQAGEQQSNES